MIKQRSGSKLRAGKLISINGDDMKKIVVAIGLLTVLNGCYAGIGSPVPGILYSDVSVPREGVGGEAVSRTGVATCESILGLVAVGDCSIAAAKDAGGIREVQHVDMKVKNILGVYAEYTTKVSGK